MGEVGCSMSGKDRAANGLVLLMVAFRRMHLDWTRQEDNHGFWVVRVSSPQQPCDARKLP